MKNLERTEEEAIRSIESILNRMEELSIKTNKNNKKYKGKLNEEYHNKKQITLLNKNSGGYIYLHIPNMPTTYE